MKTGANERCPCGSGKKFKRCCANKTLEELGVRIGTAEQKIWEDVKKECVSMIENLEKGLVVQKAFKELAEKKIAEEIEKLK